MEQGWFCLGAGLTVALTGLTSINQGKAASAAIGAASKNPSVKGKALIFVVLPETAALFGFVTGILLLVAGGVF
jgi:V/A-type H+-transporting ATPase subunit K